jgi:hypothetical protein
VSETIEITWHRDREDWTTGEMHFDTEVIVATVADVSYRGYDDGYDDASDEDQFVARIATGGWDITSDVYRTDDEAKRAAEYVIRRWLRGAP